MDKTLIEEFIKALPDNLNISGLPVLEFPTKEEDYAAADADAITYRLMAILLAKELPFKEKNLDNITVSLATAKEIALLVHPYFKWVIELEDGLIVFEYNYEFMRTAWENEKTDYCTLCGIRHEESDGVEKACYPVCPPPLEEDDSEFI